jgi:hypothetical protein
VAVIVLVAVSITETLPMPLFVTYANGAAPTVLTSIKTKAFVNNFLRKVWSGKIEFSKLDIANPELLAVGPRTVVPDNIGFKKAQ